MALEESGEMAQLDRNLSSDPQNPSKKMLGIAWHTCDPSAEGTQTGGSLEQLAGQPGQAVGEYHIQ